ncbi:uncharacterized protein METZ01_LOCUS468960, partial [marine metagenome]
MKNKKRPVGQKAGTRNRFHHREKIPDRDGFPG